MLHQSRHDFRSRPSGVLGGDAAAQRIPHGFEMPIGRQTRSDDENHTEVKVGC